MIKCNDLYNYYDVFDQEIVKEVKQFFPNAGGVVPDTFIETLFNNPVNKDGIVSTEGSTS